MFRAGQHRLALTSLGFAAAAIIGVQLGQSAISEINPVHFQGPLAPQGITPPPEPAPYDPYAQQYVWSLPPTPALANCDRDCAMAQNRAAINYAMDQSAGRDPALPPWRDATPTTELRPWAPGELPNAGIPLERYMRYPVNREQAEQATAPRAPAPMPAAALSPAAADQAPAAPAQTPPGEPLVQE